MIDRFLKWFNRKWSNWEYYDYKYSYNYFDEVSGKWEIYKRVSNDGLVEFKKYKVK